MRRRRAARRGTNVLWCESSRGLACVLVRCSLYAWALGSACRVDIDGGAVLGSLFLAKILPCPTKNDRGQPVAATTAAVLAWLGHKASGQHFGRRHNTISSGGGQ